MTKVTKEQSSGRSIERTQKQMDYTHRNLPIDDVGAPDAQAATCDFAEAVWLKNKIINTASTKIAEIKSELFKPSPSCALIY